MKFSIELEVRDYELDMQGIVNNSVYQNYLEHGRHKFLEELNVDFSKLAEEGVNLVVIRAELDYKASLRAKEVFSIHVELEKISRMKFAFNQEVIRKSDSKVILQAKVFGTCLNRRGRPEFPKEISEILEANS